MGDAIKRLCREDIFTIGHDPFHMYGNYMYQMKASNDLNNNYRYYKNQEMANNFNGKVGFNLHIYCRRANDKINKAATF